MRRLLRITYELLVLFGFDPLKTATTIRRLPAFFQDLIVLRGQRALSKNDFPFGRPYPCLGDRCLENGTARGHYFHQDLLVANRIFRNNPRTHVDVGSRIDGFVAHIASFRPIEVIDIRPLANSIANVSFIQADLTGRLPGNLVDHCDSLSCLHALEHFGLGRYGDPVNYDGYLVGLENLYAILQRAGRFYFSVPIGPQRIEFNAHRIFSLPYLLDQFVGRFKIDHFSFVDDRGDLHTDVALSTLSAADSFGCYYGCGVFEMTKL